METISKGKKSSDKAVVKDKSFLMAVYLKTELTFFGRVSINVENRDLEN